MASHLDEEQASLALDSINDAITGLHDLMGHAKDAPEVKVLAEACDDLMRRLESLVSRVSGVPIP